MYFYLPIAQIGIMHNNSPHLSPSVMYAVYLVTSPAAAFLMLRAPTRNCSCSPRLHIKRARYLDTWDSRGRGEPRGRFSISVHIYIGSTTTVKTSLGHVRGIQRTREESSLTRVQLERGAVCLLSECLESDLNGRQIHKR